MPAPVAANEAGDPPVAQIDPVRVGRGERQHRPAAVAVLVVHPPGGIAPARGLAVVARGQHRRDQLGRVRLEVSVRLDQGRRAGDERADRLALQRALVAGIAKQPTDRRDASVGILADETLAELPGIAVGKVRGIGRIVDRRIEVDHRLRGEDSQAGRDISRIQPLLRRQ